MSHDEVAMIFRRAMDAYSRGDYEAAVADFDRDIEWNGHASVAPDATTYYGPEGVKRFWDLAITRAHGMGSGSGATVASRRFAQIADFRDGRVVRVQVLGDVSHARAAAGLRE